MTHVTPEAMAYGFPWRLCTLGAFALRILTGFDMPATIASRWDAVKGVGKVEREMRDRRGGGRPNWRSAVPGGCLLSRGGAAALQRIRVSNGFDHAADERAVIDERIESVASRNPL